MDGTDQHAQRFSAASRMAALTHQADSLGRQPVAAGDVVDLLGDTGLGLTLLVLMLPVFITIPGLPVGIVFGFFVAVLGAQMAMGADRLRLPRAVRARSIPADQVARMARMAQRWLVRAEHLLHPGRLARFTSGGSQRALGLVLIVLGATLAVPIPFGNHPPALAVVVIGLGLMERDGLPILLGLVLTVVAVAWNVLLIVAGVEMLAWATRLSGW